MSAAPTPPSRRLPDQDDRDLIREALDETLIVEAAAGTGKTTALVSRVIATLAAGRVRIHEIVAVTFTEKAAGELKLRLREDLERAYARATEAAPRERLADALAHLEEAHISTIHGFCADMLRERPLEANVDPRFEVLMETAGMHLLDQAFDAWLRDALEAPGEGLRRILRRRHRFPEDDGPTVQLRRALAALADWRDFPAPWRRDPFDRATAIDDVLRALRTFEGISGTPASPRDNLYVDTEPLRRFVRQHVDASATAPGREEPRDDDALEAALVELARHDAITRARVGSGRLYGTSVERVAVRAAHEALRLAIDGFAARSGADLAACLHQELQPCLARYEALKRERGALDFVDLLVRARDLLATNAPVRVDFQRRFARIFVDEFQDTDPIQAEILLLLSADDPEATDWRQVRPVPGTLFIVGDPKQAIYRFRRADVGTYWAVKRQLLAQSATRCCHLRACFRLLPSLQHAVNAAFGAVMTGQQAEEQAEYVALEPVRTEATTQPSLVALSVPRPYATRNVSGRAIEECLPDTVGAFVAWLVQESGWTVAETGADGIEHQVPVQARHVALLFRRFVSWNTDITRPYLHALEARGVPHLLVGGRSFHAREEVEAIRAAVSAIEWPDDELSVYATLRGLLFAIPDHVLLAYRDAAPSKRLDPYRRLDIPDGDTSGGAASFRDVVDALALLQRLHKDRNRVPAHETLQTLLTRTRAHAALALRPGGEQALANVLHITEMARQYEMGGGLSFRGFVSQLQDERVTDVAEAPLLEEGSDGVRLMTVHKAKGLEFPVVILADITCGLTSRAASRHLDATRGLCAQKLAGSSPSELLEHGPLELARDRAEAHRLAYVAATRARDLLVVPAVGDAPYPGEAHGERWVDVLNGALYPPLDARTRPDPAPGCPPFGGDSVLERPDGALPGSTTVRPGAHTLGTDASRYQVVWWDPQRLHLAAELTFGARQLALVERHAPESRVSEGLQEEADWQTRRDETRRAARTPAHRVGQVTAAAAQPSAVDAVVMVEQVESRAFDRPRGRAFGSLVHEVLANVRLDATSDAIEAQALLQGRVLDATPDDCRAAALAVGTVLRHPLLVRARQADAGGRCRREWPVMARLPDGQLVEGQLDLAFEEAAGWTVVDFKTDAPTDDSRAAYRRQVSLYCLALRNSTGRPVTGFILQV